MKSRCANNGKDAHGTWEADHQRTHLRTMPTVATEMYEGRQLFTGSKLRSIYIYLKEATCMHKVWPRPPPAA
jgi:hypothetical protein